MPKEMNALVGDEKATFLSPDSAAVNPIGFAAAAIFQSHHSMAVKREMAVDRKSVV